MLLGKIDFLCKKKKSNQIVGEIKTKGGNIMGADGKHLLSEKEIINCRNKYIKNL